MAIKKLVPLFLIFAILISVTPASLAADTTSEKAITTTIERADALKELGLFLGTNNGYELEKLPNRTQAIIFLLRMLGEEKEAENSDDTCPFTDVPQWAYKYVAYAYQKGYTTGTGKTTLGANNLTTPTQFVTFMLRALGYSDQEGDFVWSASIEKAVSLGILPDDKYSANGEFKRGDCVDIIYDVLSAKMKGEDTTIADSLIAKGAVDKATAAKYGFGKKTEPEKNYVDLSSNVFLNDLSYRIFYHTAKDFRNHDYAGIELGIFSPNSVMIPKNVYLSQDGIKYEKLLVSRTVSNTSMPYALYNTLNRFELHNLPFSTDYTICIEIDSGEFLAPITIKTAGSDADQISGYGTPYGSSSTDGVYTHVGVGLNLALTGTWSYQFYRWIPGSVPIPIPGANGTANGQAIVEYEPTSSDLGSYVFCRATNDQGVIFENYGWYINIIKGMPVQENAW